MENEVKTPEIQKNDDLEKNYIEKIKELRDNTVDKDAYVRVLEENKKLLDQLTNNSYVSDKEQNTEKEVSEQELISKLVHGENMNNLEYVETALALRKKMMEDGKIDPFLPQGTQISANDDDVAAANEVAKLLEHCVGVSDGNSDIFTRELQLHLMDTPVIKK